MRKIKRKSNFGSFFFKESRFNKWEKWKLRLCMMSACTVYSLQPTFISTLWNTLFSLYIKTFSRKKHIWRCSFNNRVQYLYSTKKNQKESLTAITPQAIVINHLACHVKMILASADDMKWSSWKSCTYFYPEYFTLFCNKVYTLNYLLVAQAFGDFALICISVKPQSLQKYPRARGLFRL